jgi:hypothetical protein
MRVLAYVFMVVFQNLADEFVFAVVDRFDDEPVVAGEIEEGARFPRGSELRENVLLR